MELSLPIAIAMTILSISGYLSLGIVFACHVHDCLDYPIANRSDAFISIIILWPILFPVSMAAIWWNKRGRRRG